MRSRFARNLAWMVVLALAYFLLARLSLALTLQPNGIPAVWPPSGLALAALLLGAYRDWPALLSSVFVANLLASLPVFHSLPASVAFAIINCVEAAAAAWLMRHFLGTSITFARIREVVLGLVGLAAVMSNGVTALAAAAVSNLMLGAAYWEACWVWWVADGVGMLLVTPVIVTWARLGGRAKTLTRQQLAEGVVLLAALTTIAQWVFGTTPETRDFLLHQPYLMVPFLIWAALRFGPWGATTASLVLSAVALWDTAHDLGPFSAPGPVILEYAQDVQLFLSVTTIFTLVLAATILERRQAEEQARILQADLAHLGRLSVAGEMASGLAHELNQPLAAIATYAEACQLLIGKELPNTERLRAAAEQIAVQSRRAGEIIRRMRDFTRKTEPRRSPIQLNPLIQEMARFIETEVRKREVALYLELTEPLPPVFADAIQVQQVVLNLMRNALEAMEAVPAGCRELRIRAERVGSETVEVAVSDTGPGLSEEATERLFHPFFTTKADGMGLGLSISRSIIEAHDGRLWATANNPGPGVTFRFTLPLSDQRHTGPSP